MLRVSRKHLGEALTRAKVRLRQHAAGVGEPLSRIVVKDRCRTHVIPLECLEYVEAQGDYVGLHSRGRTLLKLQSISSLESSLDPARFVRVHRSTIVNLEQVARIAPVSQDSTVTLVDGTRLCMSRTGYARLLEALAEAEPRASAHSADLRGAVAENRPLA